MLVQIYIWGRAQGLFEHLQAVPTDGAHAAEFFLMGNTLFLAIANFGDRQRRRYNAESVVYVYAEAEEAQKFDERRCASDAEKSCSTDEHTNSNRSNNITHGALSSARGHFELAASVHTFGATDWEHFVLPPDRHYLAVSEEGDMQMGENSGYLSSVYRVQL